MMDNTQIDPYLDNRLRSDKPITFLGFIDDLRKLWETAGKTQKIIRHTPKLEEAEFPCITYRILRRQVAQGFKEPKPRHRVTIKHPYIEGEFIELYGQMFDVYVEFQVYSQSAEEADELVMELDDFLHLYKGYFMKNGVQQILFFAQDEDLVVTDLRVPVALRTLQYTIRFEKITPMFLGQIDQIAVQAQINRPQND